MGKSSSDIVSVGEVELVYRCVCLCACMEKKKKKTHQTCSLSSWFAVGWRALGPGCVADSAHTGRSRECAAGRSPCSLCAATH